MKKINFSLLLMFACVFLVSNIANAAEREYPYSSFISGLEKIDSAKTTFASSGYVYSDGVLVSGTIAESTGSAVRVGSTTYDSSSSIKTVVGDNEASLETIMKFIRKGEYSYINFKYGLAKNKWIQIEEDEYEAFGEALDLATEFELADMSDPGGEDEALLKKLAGLAEKHDLYVDYKKPVTKKKKGKTLTTYVLEFDRKAVVPFYTEVASVLSDEEKKESIVGVDGFMAALKSKYFVDALVERSYVQIVFDEASGLPVEYTEQLIVPEHQTLPISLEQYVYIKFDNINKKVKVTAPKKFITTDEALKLMGLED